MDIGVHALDAALWVMGFMKAALGVLAAGFLAAGFFAAGALAGALAAVVALAAGFLAGAAFLAGALAAAGLSLEFRKTFDSVQS
jgi:hypothetical protein